MDLIQSIISRETSLEGSPPDMQMIRSQSLSHIPSQLGSLPSLHHASSLHVLQENYASTPDFTATTLRSPPPYGQISQVGWILYMYIFVAYKIHSLRVIYPHVQYIMYSMS